MSNLSVTDVQEALRTLRDVHEVDLAHSPGMAKLHGKMYPVLGMNMHFTSKEASELNDVDSVTSQWHTPLENKHVIVGHHTLWKPSGGNSPFYNVQIPGTFKHHEGFGGGQHWSLAYPRGDKDRIGPVSVRKGGILDTNKRDTIPESLKDKTFHDLVAHASKLPSNVGTHVNYHAYPGETPFSEEDIKNFNLRDAIETEVRNSVFMDMPKGAEHLIAISHYKDKGHPNDFYVYNPHTEQLLPSTGTRLIKNA